MKNELSFSAKLIRIVARWILICMASIPCIGFSIAALKWSLVLADFLSP